MHTPRRRRSRRRTTLGVHLSTYYLKFQIIFLKVIVDRDGGRWVLKVDYQGCLTRVWRATSDEPAGYFFKDRLYAAGDVGSSNFHRRFFAPPPACRRARACCSHARENVSISGNVSALEGLLRFASSRAHASQAFPHCRQCTSTSYDPW